MIHGKDHVERTHNTPRRNMEKDPGHYGKEKMIRKDHYIVNHAFNCCHPQQSFYHIPGQRKDAVTLPLQ